MYIRYKNRQQTGEWTVSTQPLKAKEKKIKKIKKRKEKEDQGKPGKRW